MLGSTLKQSYYAHRNWLSVIEIIRQLNRLSFEVRAHRGASTAYLSGDKFFYFASRQNTQRINLCFSDLEMYHSIIEMLELDLDFKCLIHNWMQIKRHWTRSQPLENFNQHSDLLHDLNVIIWRLAVSADSSIVEKGSNDKARLCYFLLNAHTTAIESIARLRGVCSYLSAKEAVTNDERSMVEQEIKLTFIKWHEWMDAFQNLPEQYQDACNYKVLQGQITRYFLVFMEMVEPFKEEACKLPNSSEVFNSANQILSALQLQLNEGLNQLAECMPDELEAWVKGCEDLNNITTPDGLTID